MPGSAAVVFAAGGPLVLPLAGIPPARAGSSAGSLAGELSLGDAVVLSAGGGPLVLSFAGELSLAGGLALGGELSLAGETLAGELSLGGVVEADSTSGAASGSS